MDSTAFVVAAVIAIVIQTLMLLIALFQPPLSYKISKLQTSPPASDEFLRLLEALVDAPVYRRSRVEVLTNGEVYYDAEWEAIRAARHSVNLEAYIFQRGEVARRFVEALTGRARAGVRVNLLLDAIGSAGTFGSYFDELRAAGGRVEWFNPLRWYTLPRLNNRTHRELIIVDGKVGFIGGSGIADHWFKGDGQRARWRDTMFRVEGDVVARLQSTFAANWLESSGEILTGKEYSPSARRRAQRRRWSWIARPPWVALRGPASFTRCCWPPHKGTYTLRPPIFFRTRACATSWYGPYESAALRSRS